MYPKPTHHLSDDLRALADQSLQRRQALRWLSGLSAASALPLVSCGGGGDGGGSSSSSSSSTSSSSSSSASSSSSSSSASSSTSTASTCPSGVIPTETVGPYPADGGVASNLSLNALTLSGINRADIRTSVGSASGTAAGVPTTVTLTIVSGSGSTCTPLTGRAVYIWHCTRDGNYSMYSSGYTNENYLRGVQVTDSNGQVTFTTIFPGCYTGRWPHIHFEVYPSLTAAIDSSSTRDYTKVSQLGFPAAACNQVYGVASGYDSSVTAFNSITLASDNVFSDGYGLQMATVSGSVSAGYAANLTVAVS